MWDQSANHDHSLLDATSGIVEGLLAQRESSTKGRELELRSVHYDVGANNAFTMVGNLSFCRPL